MRHNNTLRKAQSYLKTRQYTKVINFLEPQVFKYRQSPEYFYILGLACLNSGDFEGGENYLRRARQLDPENERVLLAVAVYHMQKRELEKAIQLWVQILEVNYRNKYAQRALNFVKKHNHSEQMFAQAPLSKFIHPLRTIPVRYILIFLLSISTAVLLAGLIFLISGIRTQTEKGREGSEYLLIQNTEILEQSGEGVKEKKLSAETIQEIFRQMQKDFENGHDDRVQYNINRILLSNASSELKGKAESLQTFLKEENFITLKESYSLTDVLMEPQLYNNVFVRWKGRVANKQLVEEGKYLHFDFLVGYHESQIVEGIIPASVDFPVRVENSEALELIGRILYKPDKNPMLSLSVSDLRIILNGSK